MDHTKAGRWKRVVEGVVRAHEASLRPQLPDIDPEHKWCKPFICTKCYPRCPVPMDTHPPYDGMSHWKFVDTDYDKF